MAQVSVPWCMLRLPKKSPVFLGSSFAFLGSMAAALTGIGTAAGIDALKVMSFDSFTGLVRNAEGAFSITPSTFVSVPEFTFLTALGGFQEITGSYIGTIAVAYVPVAFVNSIPSCVMGGVCMALYGFIAVSGLKMLQQVDLGEDRNLFVVSTILIAGIGGLSMSFGKVKLTSIACALLLGIFVNRMLSRKKPETKE